jgi:hypothetical protein
MNNFNFDKILVINIITSKDSATGEVTGFGVYGNIDILHDNCDEIKICVELEYEMRETYTVQINNSLFSSFGQHRAIKKMTYLGKIKKEEDKYYNLYNLILY